MQIPSLLKEILFLYERKEDASLRVFNFLKKSVVFPFTAKGKNAHCKSSDLRGTFFCKSLSVSEEAIVVHFNTICRHNHRKSSHFLKKPLPHHKGGTKTLPYEYLTSRISILKDVLLFSLGFLRSNCGFF